MPCFCSHWGPLDLTWKAMHSMANIIISEAKCQLHLISWWCLELDGLSVGDMEGGWSPDGALLGSLLCLQQPFQGQWGERSSWVAEPWHLPAFSFRTLFTQWKRIDSHVAHAFPDSLEWSPGLWATCCVLLIITSILLSCKLLCVLCVCFILCETLWGLTQGCLFPFRSL